MMRHTTTLSRIAAGGLLDRLTTAFGESALLDVVGEPNDIRAALTRAVETWTDDRVALSALVHTGIVRRWGYEGLAVTLGRSDGESLVLPVHLELPAAPVQLALLGMAAIEGQIDPDVVADLDLPRDVDAIVEALVDQVAADAVRLFVGPVAAHLELDAEWLQVAVPQLDASGAVVGFEPDPEDPPVRVELGTAVASLSGAGDVDLDLSPAEHIDLPPLMVRGSGVVIDADGAGLLREDGQVVGIHLDAVHVWGLDTILPFLSSGDAEHGAASVAATDWSITADGLDGQLTVTRPGVGDGAFDLEVLTFGFDRSWYPTTLRAEGRADVGGLIGLTDESPLGFVADLELDPHASDPAARWGVSFTVRGTGDGPVVRLGAGAGSTLGGLALLAAGDSDMAVLATAMGVLLASDHAELRHVDVTALTVDLRPVPVTTPDGQRRHQPAVQLRAEVAAALDLIIPDPGGDRSLPIDLATGTVSLRLLIGDTGDLAGPRLDTDWSFDQLALSLPTAITVGSVLSITHLGVRREAEHRTVLELGTQVSGGEDVHVTGLPDLIRIVIDTRSERVSEWVYVELGRSGETLTLLVPGVLYATGTIRTGDDAALALGGQPEQWEQPMVGSLRAFLIGNGTAVEPADHQRSSSYLFDLEIGLVSAVHVQDRLHALVLTADAGFRPGLPLGTSGVSLYGLGLTYAQNARPRLPASGDYTGWYLNVTPQFSTAATKWEPAAGEWGFGASAVLGSTPDEGRAWNVTAGLFLLLPGPIVMLTGKGDLFQPPPSLSPEGPSHKASFGAALVLDLPGRRFSAELEARLQVAADGGSGRELVSLEVPAAIGVSLTDPVQSYLHLGRPEPLEARIRGTALGLLTVSGYLMVDGRGIELVALDPQTGRARGTPPIRLPGVALAFGALGSVEWSFSASVVSLHVYAFAGFDLGVSLADPPMLAGRLFLGGGIRARAFGLGVELSAELDLEAVIPQPFSVAGQVRVRMGMPWFLPDIDVRAQIAFGDDAQWPQDYPLPSTPTVTVTAVDPATTAGRTMDVAADGDGSAPPALTDVPVDAQMMVAFDVPVGNTDSTVGVVSTDGVDAPAGGSPDAWVWSPQTTASDDSRRGYRHVVTDITLTTLDENRSAPGTVLASWAPGTAGGNHLAADGRDDSGQPRTTGGQAARTHLTLFSDGGDPVARSIGTGYELTRSALSDWDPCTPLDPALWLRTYSSDVLGHLLTEHDPHRADGVDDEGRSPSRRLADLRERLGPFLADVLVPRIPSDRVRMPIDRPKIDGKAKALQRATQRIRVEPNRARVTAELSDEIRVAAVRRLLPAVLGDVTSTGDADEGGVGTMDRVPLPPGRHRLANLTPPDEWLAWLRREPPDEARLSRLAHVHGVRVLGPVVRRGPFNGGSVPPGLHSGRVVVTLPTAVAHPTGPARDASPDQLAAVSAVSGGLTLELGRHDGTVIHVATLPSDVYVDGRGRRPGWRTIGDPRIDVRETGYVEALNGRRWRLLELDVPEQFTEVNLTAAVVEKAAMGDPTDSALLLGAVAKVDVAGREGTRQANKTASQEFTASLLDQADRWAAGTVDDVLSAGTRYELAVTVESWHAQDGSGQVELAGEAVRRTYTARFTTRADAPAAELRARPGGMVDGDHGPAAEATDSDLASRWEVAVRPEDGAPAHYRSNAVEFSFRRGRAAAAIAMYGRQVRLRLIDSQGRDQYEAAEFRFGPAGRLEPDQHAVAEAWLRSPCVLDGRDPGWMSPEAISTVRGSLLVAGEQYVAELHAVPQDVAGGEWAGSVLLHRWRFRASRWASATEHLMAHRSNEEIVFDVDLIAEERRMRERAADRTSDGHVVDEIALDRALIDGMGLMPRPAPAEPVITTVWNWATRTDDLTPVALLLDGPEPLLRDGVRASIRVAGNEHQIHVLTGHGRARSLVWPAEQLPAGPVELVLTDEQRSHAITVAVGNRPTVLTSEDPR